ncbi:hypothetical protein C8F04DRAFT_1273387 [Mycena alexandri]|uniref:Uncharacterized protein n=1 Tax=Mycena alexandri TaxID=1745969 RepID=A0AAD6S6W3_9AGAR|nr:hypothetical protein C8F04DRAFT_1273387 [Mycena alexandri]
MSSAEKGYLDILYALIPDFRVTRSGRAFSPWEAVPITTELFTISTAVSDALDHSEDEDLAEPDDATHPVPPVAIDAPVSAAATDTPAIVATDAAALQVKNYVDLQPPARRPEHIKQAAPAVKTKLHLKKQRVASTGWIGLRDSGQSTQEEAAGFEEPGWTPSHTLPDFFAKKPKWRGFKLVKYLGPRTRPILDATGRIFGLQGGHPDDPNWMAEVHDPAVEAMEAARSQCKMEPGALVNGVINAAVLASLMSNIAFIRLAGFATGLFANWAPNLYSYYLVRIPFGRRVPLIWARGHAAWAIRDHGNLAFGWCAITALGNYDYTKGGHLILWDCKLILEFPPGTTILIPSAAIFHSNIPIGPGERRYPFTQYTAGGIFRWIEHGFRCEED